MSDDDGVLWLTDTRGRLIGVPSERVAYVEIETPTARPSAWGSAAPDAAPSVSVGPASVPALLDRRLLFVTGKGGVGKSTVTAAIALLAAEQGQRVLLVEVDAKGNLTNLFEHEPVGFDPSVGVSRRPRDAASAPRRRCVSTSSST